MCIELHTVLLTLLRDLHTVLVAKYPSMYGMIFLIVVAVSSCDYYNMTAHVHCGLCDVTMRMANYMYMIE